MLSVIKIGGNIIDNDLALKSFLKRFSEFPSPKILVHGGGKLATRLSEQLGIPTNMIDGRRVTDAPTLQIVTMVYAGWINKNITVGLQALNCNAFGLSGADGALIPAKKRSPIPMDFGFVGDINTDDIKYLDISKMLNSGQVPVFCSIAADGDGTLLNCNADTIASSIAIAMSKLMPVRLVFCFEKVGVLSDPEDNNSYIPSINKEQYNKLKEEGVITKGMIPKIDNAFKAIDCGVKEVHIKHADNLNNMFGTVFA